MNKIKKLLLLTLTALAFIFSAVALASCGDKKDNNQPSEGLIYTLNIDGQSYSVTGLGSCTDKKIIIADTYEGKPVTAIGDNAFIGYDIEKRTLTPCIEITSVIIPESIISIGQNAFYTCVGLKNIIISDSVTSIANGAFYCCYNLETVTIGNNVKTIGDNAFGCCLNLTSFTIGENVTSIGKLAFYDCHKLIEIYDLSPTVDIQTGTQDNGYAGYYAKVIHTSSEEKSNITKTADEYIFYENGDDVFLMGYAGNKTQLDLPNKFNNKNYGIYTGAFFNGGTEAKFIQFSNINIPNCVTSIGDGAFAGCNSIENITIPYSTKIIGDGAFSNCSALTNLLIREGVEIIGDDAFSSCINLSTIRIPDSVTSIGRYAFQNCLRLKSATIGRKVASIGDGAFSSCYKLVEVYDLSTTLEIKKGNGANGAVGYYAKAVYISSDIKSKLNNMTGGYIFYENGNEVYLVDYTGTATELILPANYKGKEYEINRFAFGDYFNLKSIVISDSVTSIANQAFYFCYNLESITIGKGVKTIGSEVLFYCDNLTSIIFQGTQNEWAQIEKSSDWDKSAGSYVMYYNN